MSAAPEWKIPPSVLRWLAEIPADRPVALLMRHSVRGPLPAGDEAHAVPITDVGRKLACELGRTLGARLKVLHTSPLVRCRQTAEALRKGAAVDVAIVEDRLLGDPGVFVVDGVRARANWDERGHASVMADLVANREPLPGMAAPSEAARFLVHHMLATSQRERGVHVFVTHDSLVTATAAWLFGEPLGVDDWPWYLEAAFFWREGEKVRVAYRDRSQPWLGGPLCGLDERDVIELARREVARVLGPACDARFFLAGGAFKSLLTGHPPRDLDLWAPSDRDREAVITKLLERGAKRIGAQPFADAFEIDGRVVDVPHKTEPTTLEERLARFDLALSAVGVEHSSGDHWRAVVHPLARTSVERREILLLKPLVNSKYALATLERLRRYAAELRYTVPAEEEAEVWRVFEGGTVDTREGMLERFDRAALGGYGVREEALSRFR